jgi:quinoprotein glucose dehydrogenase
VGDTPNNVLEHPALQGMEIPNTGTGRQAAQIVTPSLLIYSGNGSDNTPYLYAVDKATGERLAQVELPGSVRYGMMTYVHGGKQYLVVNVVGGNVALALP